MNFNLNHTLSFLNRTPESLQTLLAGLPEAWTHHNEGENTWSPYDIIGHFIHGEKTDWVPRARIILSDEAHKEFVPFDRFAQFENSKGKSLEVLLEEFKQLRKENVETVRSWNITPNQLNRTGLHPDLGSVTLKQLLSTWQVHDFSHLNQLSRVMAKIYRDEVGPWAQYISLIRG